MHETTFSPLTKARFYGTAINLAAFMNAFFFFFLMFCCGGSFNMSSNRNLQALKHIW